MYYKGFEGTVQYNRYRALMIGSVQGLPLTFSGRDVRELTESFYEHIEKHLRTTQPDF